MRYSDPRPQGTSIKVARPPLGTFVAPPPVNPLGFPNLQRDSTIIDNTYRVIKFHFKTGSLNTVQNTRTEYNIQGDHIFVSELGQTRAVYIKLDSDRNPWIRVIQGDTITRGFNKFYLRVADSAISTRGAYGKLYVSTGPLLTRRYKNSGIDLQGVLTARNITITAAAEVSLLSLLTNQIAVPTVGSYGGTILITNEGPGVLGIEGTFGSGVAPNAYYPIYPQSTLTLDLASALMSSDPNGVPVGPGFLAISGTCTLAFMISGESDLGVPGPSQYDGTFGVE